MIPNVLSETIRRLTLDLNLEYPAPVPDTEGAGRRNPSGAANQPQDVLNAAFLSPNVRAFNGGPGGAAARLADAPSVFLPPSRSATPSRNGGGGNQTATGARIMANSLSSVFSFQSTSVRTVADDRGEPWFSAKDVCDVLGYRNDSDAIKKHCREKGVAKRDTLTDGGMQSLTFINEGNLYRLIVKSRKPEAEAFEQWVMEEVLPAIRKTGSYTAKPYAVNPGDTLTAEEADTLRQMLTDAANRAPKEKQKAIMLQGWSKLKSHFGVPYRQIPRAEFTEAVSLIARHVAEGEYLPRQSAAVNPEISDEMLNQLALRELTKPSRRFMTVFCESNGETYPVMYAIPKDAVTLTPAEIVKHIGEPGEFPKALLPALIQSAASRLGAAA